MIHYDEKWFWGMVTKSTARTFDGLDQQTQQAYHKSHINKTMVVAFTAYAFKDCMDNGGDGIKLGLFRAQSYKVAKRMVRQRVRQRDGSFRATGEIIRQKGDLFLVHCAVTGSNEGTSDNPKFLLRQLFETTIFPDVEKLVGPGGKYEGYKVIFQGDNAGPHKEQAYFDFVTSYCREKGWYWKPQAPQMPHMNNLDLSVFPCMSRRHTQLAREQNRLRMLTEDQIWNTAKSVWDRLPSSKVASGFIQAHRIAQRVIEFHGSVSWLHQGESMRIHKITVLLTTLALSSACRSVTKKDMMVNNTNLRSESHEVWNRPTEVGFTVGDYIEGTSETSKLFGVIRTGGDPTAGGSSIPSFGASAPSLSANAKWAVSNAVDKAGADGIYITKIVEEKKIIFPVWTRKAWVRGKALTLKDFGPIDDQRADLDRLGYPPAKK